MVNCIRSFQADKVLAWWNNKKTRYGNQVQLWSLFSARTCIGLQYGSIELERSCFVDRKYMSLEELTNRAALSYAGWREQLTSHQLLIRQPRQLPANNDKKYSWTFSVISKQPITNSLPSSGYPLFMVTGQEIELAPLTTNARQTYVRWILKEALTAKPSSWMRLTVLPWHFHGTGINLFKANDWRLDKPLYRQW